MMATEDDDGHRYEVHIWSGQSTVIELTAFKDDRPAAIRAAQTSLVTSPDRPSSFTGVVTISPSSLAVSGLVSESEVTGTDRFARENFVFMATTNSPGPMMTVVLKRSTAVRLECMVLELKSRFDMLQLRSDFEVMKLGVMPSRSLQLVLGKSARPMSAAGTSSTDTDGVPGSPSLFVNLAMSPSVRGAKEKFVEVDGALVPMRSKTGPSPADRPRSSRVQWARRSIAGAFSKMSLRKRGSANLPSPPASPASPDLEGGGGGGGGGGRFFRGSGHAEASADTLTPLPMAPGLSGATADHAKAIAIGDKVAVKGYNSTAMVRYIGDHHIDGTPRFGLELNEPEVKNNGTVGGHEYFQCRPGHGVLVRPGKVTPLLVATNFSGGGMNKSRWSLRGKGRPSRSPSPSPKPTPTGSPDAYAAASASMSAAMGASPPSSPGHASGGPAVTETSIDGAIMQQAATVQQQTVMRQASVRMARHKKITLVMRQFAAVPADALLGAKDVDRYFKYVKASTQEKARAVLQQKIAAEVHEVRRSMQLKAKQQISAIRASRLGVPDSPGGGGGASQGDDEDDDIDGYLELGAEPKESTESIAAMELYRTGKNVSGVQMRLVVKLKMAAVTVEIERQHKQAIRQVRVQTQMRTRQELIQKVASMRRSKKKRRDYGESLTADSPSPPVSPDMLPPPGQFASPSVAKFLPSDAAPSPPEDFAEPAEPAEPAAYDPDVETDL